MEHADLVEEVAARLGSSRAAEAAVDAFLESIQAAVVRGERVVLSGFGAFDLTVPHQGSREPRLRFRPGGRFRELVNAGPGSLPPTTKPRLGNAPYRRQDSTAPVANRSTRTAVSRAKRTVAPSLQFIHYVTPPGVSLSALILPETSRCGIYVLHFDDGRYYVGQARDVLTRFSKHRRTWGVQIVGIDFAPAALSTLNDLEQRTIQRYEADGKELYNSALVGLPMGDTPLDLVVDRVEQERWLLEPNEDSPVGISPDRLELALSRRRTGEKFRALSAREDYQAIRAALFVYTFFVLPDPGDTERRFWTMTAMPSTNRSRRERRLTTLSVNNVETLVIGELPEAEGWQLGGFVNVAPGIVPRRRAVAERASYRTVGEVDRIHFTGTQPLLDLLQDPQVLIAARRLAIGLMRKGRGMMAKYHDQSLADDVLSVLGDIPTQ